MKKIRSNYTAPSGCSHGHAATMSYIDMKRSIPDLPKTKEEEDFRPDGKAEKKKNDRCCRS